MGAVLTQRLQEIVAAANGGLAHIEQIAETPEFTGRVIAALYDDPDMMELTAATHIGAELGVKYGITDRDGRQPPSFRDLMHVEPANYRRRPSR
jgi:hypothetical protein